MGKLLIKGLFYAIIAYIFLTIFGLIPNEFNFIRQINIIPAVYQQEFLEPNIDNGLLQLKKIALTFDDGYGLNNQKLEILENYTSQGMGLTFFLVGDWIGHYPDIFEQLKTNPHFELANHTEYHQSLISLNNQEIKLELELVESRLSNSSHKLIRFPYGKPCGHNLAPCPPVFGTREREIFDFVTNNLGFTVVGWNISTADHENVTSTNDIVQRIQNGVLRGGNIVLLHTQGQNTFSALEIIIPWLFNNGYFPSTVSCTLNLPTCQ